MQKNKTIIFLAILAVAFFVFLIVSSASAAGLLEWTDSVTSIVVEKGKSASAVLSATGGNDTKFSCNANCIWQSVEDNGDGTAILKVNPPGTIAANTYGVQVIATSESSGESVSKVVNIEVKEPAPEAPTPKADCPSKFKEDCPKFSECFWLPTGSGACYAKTFDGGATKEEFCGLVSKGLCGTAAGSQTCEWTDDKCIPKGSGTAGGVDTGGTDIGDTGSAAEEANLLKDYVGPLPPCAFEGSCRSVNDLIQLVVNFGNFCLVAIGGFAFVFFVYGGFTMILSFGNPEKVKKGRDTLIAAVVGIAIALSAFILIKFMTEALGLKEAFNPLIKK